ncbi:hypothetical protein KXD40_007426 [Peronospora effusa]|nr:hypothetical protein KXD40_007426 [Peronospora effusa]
MNVKEAGQEIIFDTDSKLSWEISKAMSTIIQRQLYDLQYVLGRQLHTPLPQSSFMDMMKEPGDKKVRHATD